MTSKEGVILSGSFSGLKDINDTVIRSSAAALNASRILKDHVTDPSVEDDVAEIILRDVSKELPKTLISICECEEVVSTRLDKALLSDRLEKQPPSGWQHNLFLLLRTLPGHQPAK